MTSSIGSPCLFQYDHNKYHLDDFKLQVDKINVEKYNSSTVALRKALGFINLKCRKSYELNYISQLVAEHMSQGPLNGGYAVKSLTKIIYFLGKITSTDAVKRVIQQLEYTIKIHLLRNSPLQIPQIKRDLARLQLGESIVVPSEVKCHAMLTTITLTKIKDEEKLFTVVLYNEGEGLEYHYRKGSVEDGQLHYQVGLVITDVKGEKLVSEYSDFIEKTLYIGSIEKFYEKTLSELEGKIASPSKDSRLWSPGQLGGSCCSSCINAFIRASLPNESFAEYHLIAKTKYLLKLYHQIKKGCGNSSLRKLIALDIIKQLEKNKEHINSDFTQVLWNIKKELREEDFYNSKSKKINNRKMKVSNSSILNEINYNFEKAINVIIKSNFNESSVKEATPFLEKALLPYLIQNINIKDYKEFVKIAIKTMSYCEKKPLNYDQIYIAAVISCIIKNIIAYPSKLPVNNFLCESERMRLMEFSDDMLKKCSLLALDKVFNYTSPYNFYFSINFWKKRTVDRFSKDLISPNMKRMIDSFNEYGLLSYK